MRKGSGSPGLRTAARRGHVPPSLYRPLVRWLAPGRVAQRESARLTRERSLVRTQPRPPADPQLSEIGRGRDGALYRTEPFDSFTIRASRPSGSSGASGELDLRPRP